MDMSPPQDAPEFAGWKLPSQPKKSVRLSNFGLVLYFVPSDKRADWCDVFAFARVSAPVPQWMVPLSLIKRFLANHFVSVFKAIKENIVQDWDKLQYRDRIDACPEFYGP